MEIDRWMKNPMVKEAARKAKGDTLGTLEVLLDTMNELEDRFPGVPFETILSRAGGRPDNLRERLRGVGACEADIAIVCGEHAPMAEAIADSRKELWALASSGLSRQDMLALGHSVSYVTNARNLPEPMSERQELALQMVADGVSAVQMVGAGISRATRWLAIEKQAYQMAAHS